MKKTEQTLQEKLQKELENYKNNSSNQKDYFLNSKELSAWLKEKEN